MRKLYDNFEEVFCAFCMAVMVGCLIIQVIIRVVAGSSLAWTEELSRYSFLWTVYIGAALVTKRNGQVRITAQFIPFSPQFRLLMRIIADTIWVVFSLYIAWHSWVVIKEGMEFPEISPTLHIVKSYVEMIIPAGFVLLSWRVVEDYIRRYQNGTLLHLVRDEAEMVKEEFGLEADDDDNMTKGGA
ncbi:TRAP transporter small permease [Desulfovibrio sp. OttesenSCG-928-G15]|nr:TRAP transporter small permease [Desulfovibrio sp. OttesenSCG-928-G15]